MDNQNIPWADPKINPSDQRIISVLFARHLQATPHSPYRTPHLFWNIISQRASANAKSSDYVVFAATLNVLTRDNRQSSFATPENNSAPLPRANEVPVQAVFNSQSAGLPSAMPSFLPGGPATSIKFESWNRTSYQPSNKSKFMQRLVANGQDSNTSQISNDLLIRQSVDEIMASVKKTSSSILPLQNDHISISKMIAAEIQNPSENRQAIEMAMQQLLERIIDIDLQLNNLNTFIHIQADKILTYPSPEMDDLSNSFDEIVQAKQQLETIKNQIEQKHGVKFPVVSSGKNTLQAKTGGALFDYREKSQNISKTDKTR